MKNKYYNIFKILNHRIIDVCWKIGPAENSTVAERCLG